MKARRWQMAHGGWDGRAGTPWPAAVSSTPSGAHGVTRPTSKGSLPLHLCFCFLFSALCFSALAQYAIDWHTINGGGGTSTNGQYAISGTIGQADANTVHMAGGSFMLDGGFWAVIAVQTEGAPYLSIVSAGPGQALIAWDPDSPGWVLQETESLTVPSWSNAPSLSTNNVTVPTTPPVRFYRLFMP